MNNNLDKIEEDLKKEKRKKEHKTSGRSVFQLQKIIKEKTNPQVNGQDDEEKNRS